MIKKLLILLLLGSLYACAAPIVRDDRYGKSVGALSISCEKPYRLARNCDSVSLATGISEIQGKVFQHSGNEAGDVIFITERQDSFSSMTASAWERAWVFYGIKDPVDLEIESILRIVESVFANNQIKIQRIIPVDMLLSVYGYFLELDKPGYHILEQQYSAPR